MDSRLQRSHELMDELVDADLAEKSAAAAKLTTMLRFADHQQDFAELEADAQHRRHLVSFIADEIALALNLSVRSVQNTLQRARLVRARLPQTWLAFNDGLISAHTVQHLGEIAGRLTLSASFEQFDPACATYAAHHNAARTIAWAKRRVEALEPWTKAERAAAGERADGGTPTDEGGTELWARLPTQMALEAGAALNASLNPSDHGLPVSSRMEHAITRLLANAP